ncbi:MAG TPA: hypothetical protein VI455_01900 [Terriglobia bacterium]
MRIEIAPHFFCDDWSRLKSNLPADGRWDAAPHEWQTAIDVVENRIESRFFQPARVVDDLQHSGFAVLALDCLLLEAIQGLRNGKRAAKTGDSCKQFVRVLTTSRHFAAFFGQNDLAARFFSDVRNGLLHDGETRGGWIVKASGRYPLLERREDGFVMVNRRKFHRALVHEFDDYLKRLADCSENESRKNLIKALDGLCERSQPRASKGGALSK